MIEVEIEADGWRSLGETEALAQAAGDKALELGESDGDVVVLLTDDATVQDLNARFRGKDRPTNVLSFPAADQARHHLGDVCLAYETCAREAAEQGKRLADHLQHLVAHGVLHLIGYDHEVDVDAQIMEALERRILAALGVADPYA